MTKKEVQQRVLQNGKPLSLSKFSWDEKTNTFSTPEGNLVLDFTGINKCTFKTGSYCTFNTGYYCTFKTGSYCTFKTGSSCTFKTGSNCTFNTSHYCTFNTNYNCTFTTGSHCTFTTGFNCTFTTGSTCTFTTGSTCTFTTGFNCTFTAGSYCFIIYNNRIIIPCEESKEYYTFIKKEQGYSYLSRDKNTEQWYIENTDVKAVIVDSIVSKLISKKGNVYKLEDFNNDTFYAVTDGVNFAHGKTIQEARESLLYKISNRDTSVYNNLTLSSEVTFKEGIEMYRVITGACEEGVKRFVKDRKIENRKYTISEIIKLTESNYGGSTFKNFFIK